jgi:succinate dehydrogenase hydrophobic anchor subunit
MLRFRKNQGKSEKMAAQVKGQATLTSAGAGTLGSDQGEARPEGEVRRKLLVVAKDYTFTTGVMEYATNLAERLGYDLIAMNLNPALEAEGRFFSPYQRHLRAKFAHRARSAWEMIQPEVARRGIQGEHVVKFEAVPQAVSELNREIKRLDFVITDVDIQDEEIAGGIPLPVFSITGHQGEKIMAKGHDRRSKPWGKTITFGVLTAALYAAVFGNGSTVMTYFTKGGWFAALPIATVFAISFAHGAFANYLWSVLGIEAVKRVQPRPEAARPVARKRPRPQLRLNV